MTEKIRVVIVDDHPMFRDGVANMLNREADFEVVGQGATANQAIELVRDLLPDLLLLDLDLPGSGLTAAQTIASVYPVTRIIVLTASEDEEHVVAALKAGARAYILKGLAAREVVAILKSVWAGQGYVPPALAASMLSEPGLKTAGGRPGDSPKDELTERERQILERLAIGLSNKEIGQQLHLTEKTVKHYMTNILQKLQVRNRVEAALLAQKGGLIERKNS